jgi:hypothetical protein
VRLLPLAHKHKLKETKAFTGQVKYLREAYLEDSSRVSKKKRCTALLNADAKPDCYHCNFTIWDRDEPIAPKGFSPLGKCLVCHVAVIRGFSFGAIEA